MNRCPTKTTRFRRLMAPALMLAMLTLAHADLSAQTISRPFPPKTQRGAMVITNPPDIVMNGKTDRLSPGARIRGQNNMMVMSGTLVGQNLLVNFVREPNGMVHEVWILNEAEARQVLPTGGITLVN
jgi:hypothetical protein